MYPRIPTGNPAWRTPPGEGGTLWFDTHKTPPPGGPGYS